MEDGHVRVFEQADLEMDVLDAWRRLAVERENPFVSPEWYEAWREDRERPLILAWSHRSEAVDGVLPLVQGRRGPLRELRFAGARRGDWFGPACAAADEEALARACLGELGSRAGAWDLLRLDRIERDAVWRSAADAVFGGSRRAIGRPDVLPCIDLDCGYEGWLASRSRNFRSQLGRRRRRAERDHGLRFREAGEGAELDADLGLLFRLHAARRREQGGEGMLPGAAREAHRRFAHLAHGRGWLRMHVLELDGEPVAAWYGWMIGKRYGYVLSGFEPRYERLAVGTLLLARTIERAAEEGARVYDMLWGDEQYKSRFETRRRTVQTMALGSGPRGRMAVSGRHYAARARGSLPQALRRQLRRVRTRVARR